MQVKLNKKPLLSNTSILHYNKLFFRSCLFLIALIIYIVNRVENSESFFGGIENKPIILVLIWLVFVIEMLLRFFPSKFESMGCQKQFAHNLKKTKKEDAKPKLLSGKITFAVAATWISLNSVIGILYFNQVIDEGILLLISLAFSICDMICILYFCPFQTWFMKNKCCTSCRIYNWDFAMMFTPLLFIRNVYTWSLLALALFLLVRWEVAVHRHPERFSETTNDSLSCANCSEKLCHHKRQLRHFLEENKNRLHLKGNVIISNAKGIVDKTMKESSNNKKEKDQPSS